MDRPVGATRSDREDLDKIERDMLDKRPSEAYLAAAKEAHDRVMQNAPQVQASRRVVLDAAC